jgi:hypothetical protein
MELKPQRRKNFWFISPCVRGPEVPWPKTKSPNAREQQSEVTQQANSLSWQIQIQRTPEHCCMLHSDSTVCRISVPKLVKKLEEEIPN